MSLEETIQNAVRLAVAPLEQKIDELSAKLYTPPVQQTGGIELAVEVTGYKESTIYDMTAKRRIPFSKPDGKLIFKRAELLQWLEENKRKTVRELV